MFLESGMLLLPSGKFPGNTVERTSNSKTNGTIPFFQLFDPASARSMI